MKVISREIPETLARSLLQLKKHVVQMNDMADRIAGGSMTRAALDEEIRQILGKPKPEPKIVNPPAPAAQAPTLDVALVNAGIEKSPAGEVIDPAQIAYEKAIDEDSGFTASLEQSAEPTPAEEETEPLAEAKDLPLLAKTEEKAEVKTEPKPAAAKPAASVAPPPAAPFAWKRKLSIEETANGVRVNLMSEKGLVIKNLIGNLETTLEQLPGILAEATEAWTKKEGDK